MKKVIILVFMVTMLSALFAELEVNIPFDLAIVGESYTEVGDYDYETDWIEVINTGAQTQTYTFRYTYQNMPADWSMSVCKADSSCFMSNFPTPIEIASGETLLIHAVIYVESCAGFNFDFKFSDGDLTEPMVYEFTFDTEDNLDAADDYELGITNFRLQNYPNPFSSETTISFNLATTCPPTGGKSHENTRIEIYNVKGQKVKTLNIEDCKLNIASPVRSLRLFGGEVVWDGKNGNGKNVSSGIYFYKMQAGKQTRTRKMMLLR